MDEIWLHCLKRISNDETQIRKTLLFCYVSEDLKSFVISSRHRHGVSCQPSLWFIPSLGLLLLSGCIWQIYFRKWRQVNNITKRPSESFCGFVFVVRLTHKHAFCVLFVECQILVYHPLKATCSAAEAKEYGFFLNSYNSNPHRGAAFVIFEVTIHMSHLLRPHRAGC